MAKKSLKVEEVKKLREENAPRVFNMMLALEAIEKTKPIVSRAGKSGAFTTTLVDMFKEVGKPLAINQIIAAFKANGQDVTNKQVADKCWLLSDANKKNKSPILKKGIDKGSYELI